jgi:multiple sugar transport system ATP-binding protein
VASVTFDGVTKVFPDGTCAVDELDLDVGDGEFVVLVGPSGCGKTTALRMVAGLEDISEGTVRIGDRVVNHVPSRDRDIAMVFQSYALYPHLSVYDNIAFGLKLKKEKKDEIDRRVKEAARILGLEPFLKRKPPAVSGSALPWAARSSGSHRRFSWTSRSRTSTRSCASRCAPRSRRSRTTSA